ncbi:hypothetical protein AM493_13840 [Flavobacterium akiainvivens]|uniref:Uncharacterized protein n=2 Tax=Flavobacterium akiainvivens TaxID=1202724 RepID=A0A0M8MIM4_9FLAO|nr:hypothetical protein AM493_13840 [Flavobacterium akiainvivens]
MASDDSNWVIISDGQGNRAFEKNGASGSVNIRGTSVNIPSTATGGFNIFNTAEQTTNTEKGFMRFNSNVLEVGYDFGGTGTFAKPARFGSAATATSGMNRYLQTQAQTPFFSYYFGGTGLPGFIMDIGGNGALQGNNVNQGAVSVTPTIAQTGGASYKALWIAPYEASTGNSGNNMLIEAGTTSAANGGGTFTRLFAVDNTGIARATSFANLSTINNAHIQMLANGTSISRNIADANAALTLNQANAASTGNILSMQLNGTVKAYFTTQGHLGTNRIAHTVDANNAAINLNANGLSFTRNVNDVNPVVTVDQLNASSTGLLQKWSLAGTTVAGLDKSGNMSLSGQITVYEAPTAPNHVVRKAELDSKINLSAYINITTGTTLTVSQFGANGQLDVYVNATAAPVTVTLPTAVAMAGYQVNIIKTDATTNAVTIQGASGVNINQSATYVLPSVGAKAAIKSNATQYWVF